MSEKISENKFTCIMCPLGCVVTVKSDDYGEIKEVIGNSCKKGEQYAKDELTRPLRVLTSTVALEGAKVGRLPVRTSGFIPKEKTFDCMKELQSIKVKAPVHTGDVIVKDILGLKTDIVATRDLI